MENQQLENLESTSGEETTLSPEIGQNPEIIVDPTITYAAKTDRIRAWSQFIKSATPYLWAIVIVLVIIPLVGRGFIANSYQNNLATPSTNKHLEVVVKKTYDWSKIDQDVVTAIKKADSDTRDFAETKLDSWVDELMTRVDDSFLDWYFDYFNQKKIEVSVPFVWLSSAVSHWVDNDKPSPQLVVAEKMIEDFQLEFAKRVLRPKIAQFQLERITIDTVNQYISQLEKNISSIQGNYDIPQGKWERYLNDIAITINDNEGVSSNLSLKLLVGGGGYLFVKSAIPTLAKIGSKISINFAGKAGAKIAAKSGGAIVGKVGAEFLDPIIGIGVIIWDFWDYNQTVNVNRPILRQAISEYLHEVKNSLLDNPTNGIMQSIHQLEGSILKLVQS